LRSWSCQARALASSSRLARDLGGLPVVAVQIAKSSARPAVLSSESLGIVDCLGRVLDKAPTDGVCYLVHEQHVQEFEWRVAKGILSQKPSN
jgi:hypothetical protein